MSEKTREVPQFADATYAHTLVIESTHEYKVHGPYGSNFPCTIGATCHLLGFFGSGPKSTVGDSGFGSKTLKT